MKKVFLLLLLAATIIVSGSCKAAKKSSSKDTKKTTTSTTRTLGKTMDAEQVLNGKEGVFANISTARGDIFVELYYKDTPLTVINFVGLAEGTLDANKGKKFYNNLKFHRVIADFMIQGGDPTGTGAGGPGYKFADEIVDKYVFDGAGILAMANAGAGTNGSQFFITHVETPWLNGKHTIFGRVVNKESQDVVNAIKQDDYIRTVTIYRRGAEAEAFTATQADFDRAAKEAKEKVAKAAKEAAEKQQKMLSENFPNFDKNADGILYKVTKTGSGAKCGKGKNVAVEYKGYLVDGSVFDQSAGRGPLEFKTGARQMIPGFDTMVQDMCLNEKRTIVLPPEQAYGPGGYPPIIPENAYIAFDVELVKIK